MAKISGYSLYQYGAMVMCEPRMSAFAAALRGAITPGCTVIDLGAGPGIFAILACRLGAGKVIAIEPDPAIGLLAQLARDNDCADRIEIFRGKSTDYHSSTRADVIVSDLRGGLPLFESHIESIRDARERLLAPNGVMIPGIDHLRIAAVESSVTYDRFDLPWRRNDYDLDLSAGSRFALNEQTRFHLGPEVLLGGAQHLATLDYHTVVDPNLRRKVALPIDRDGIVHGLLMWFETELAPGATYSNAPGEPPLVYRQTFCPLEQPIAVEAGDTIHAEIMANLIDEDYIWSWNTGVARGPDGAVTPCFRQSTFLGQIFQRGQLAARSDAFVPPPSDRAAVDALTLTLIDGVRDVKAIAEAVAMRYPAMFADRADAFAHVARLVRGYDERD